jgi:hypothetical protein
MYSDELMERLLAGQEIPEELIHQVARAACQQQQRQQCAADPLQVQGCLPLIAAARP